MNNLKIFVTNHIENNDLSYLDKETYFVNNVYENPQEYENINKYNDIFCEFTTMYLVWRNPSLQTSVMGFCHYRRLITPDIVDPMNIKIGRPQYWSLYKLHLNEQFRFLIEHRQYNVLVSHLMDMYLDIKDEDLYDAINYMSIELDKFMLEKMKVPIDRKFLAFDENGEYDFITKSIFACNPTIFNVIVETIWKYINHCMEMQGFLTLDQFANHMRQKNWYFRRLYAFSIEMLISALIKYYKGFSHNILWAE